MNVLVIAEHHGADIDSATLNAVTAALELGPVDVLVAGQNCIEAAAAAAAVPGVVNVLHADAPEYANCLPENLAPLVVWLAGEYRHIIAAATANGKNLMPRVAALLDVQQISDVIKILSPDTFVRPIYAGNGLATVQSEDRIKVLTVRRTAFAAAMGQGGSGAIEAVALTGALGISRFVRREVSSSERPELSSARIVISGGRGMQSGDNFRMLEAVADRLGAAVGASRAAVDAGFMPNECQVGQTGKVVAPELYIAVGISGAIQHLAGMKDSKVIVAINNDKEAPIFSVADYGLVADLFEAIPQLITELD